MKALYDLSKSAHKDHVNGWMVKQLLAILLTEDSGNLKDALKAQSLAIAIYFRHDFGDYVFWMFNPRTLTKRAGGEMRKFFVRHAASALYSVERYIQVLHQEFGRYSLCDVGEELSQKYDLATPLWSKILAFTGFRNDNHKDITRLCNTCEVINTEVVPFFFGCIQACLNRTFELKVPSIAWDLIFDFAGLNAKNFTGDLDGSMGPLYTRAQLMARYRHDEAEVEESDETGSDANESDSSNDDVDESSDGESGSDSDDDQHDDSNDDDNDDDSGRDSENHISTGKRQRTA